MVSITPSLGLVGGKRVEESQHYPVQYTKKNTGNPPQPGQSAREENARAVDSSVNRADGVDAADCEWRGHVDFHGMSLPSWGLGRHGGPTAPTGACKNIANTAIILSF